MIAGKDFIGIRVNGLLIDDQQRVLLAKRHKESTTYPSYWSLPGGTIEPHEGVVKALQRKIQEELGIEIEVVRLLTLTDDIFEETDLHWIGITYLVRPKDPRCSPENHDTKDIEEIKWYGLGELPVRMTKQTKDGVKAFEQSARI